MNPDLIEFLDTNDALWLARWDEHRPPHTYDRAAQAARGTRFAWDAATPLLLFDCNWRSYCTEHRVAMGEAYARAGSSTVRLPWSSLLIEDRQSLTLLSLDVDRTEVEVGSWFTLLEWKIVTPRWRTSLRPGVSRATRRACEAAHHRGRLVMVAMVRSQIEDFRWLHGFPQFGFSQRCGEVAAGLLFDGVYLALDNPPTLPEFAGTMQTSFEQASLAAVPFGWVVERQPTSPTPTTTKERKAATFAASNYRTLHVILTPREQQEAFHGAKRADDDTEHVRSAPRSHPRRGHWRRLATKAAPVWVRPSWIGPQEATWNGARYRVRLDL